jgi:ankyrin repeat protein
VDVAWQLVLSRKVEPSFEAWLRARVAEADRLRSRKFSTLHKIICGLCSHDLESELLNSTTSIDEVDAGGWTPLVWAAYCQDWYAIDLLLKFGADATIANKKGQLALHQACREGLGDVVSDECLATITRLAAATTNLNKKDVYGDTPLMYAAEHDGDPRVLRTLHKAGASLHEVDLTGHTVLHIAIYFDNARAIETLVDLGAYIDQLSSGHTPLMKTFICNAHESMKLLFRLGADVTLPEPDGGTLLHVAAINADAASFDILASEVAVKILDPNSPNREGHTASQLFREKRLVKAEKDTVETWDSLIDELRVEMLMRSASSLQMRNSWNSAEEGLASPTSSGADTDLYFDAEHELTDNDEKKLLSDGS